MVSDGVAGWRDSFDSILFDKIGADTFNYRDRLAWAAINVGASSL
jgi:hypothetical protein